jgi:hypothetical protein
MGTFRLFDREKQEEEAAIRSIITALTSKFDRWVVGWDYDNGSPTPTADQASILEDEQIDLLLKEFDTLILDKTRVQSQWAWRRKKLLEALQWRKGALYRKCTNHANVFQEAAKNSMHYCMETYNDFSQGLDDLIAAAGTTSSDLDIVFQNILDNCSLFVDSTFPGGVHALENHCADMPDGMLTYEEFLLILDVRKQEYKETLRLARTNHTSCQANCICCSLRSTFEHVLQAQQNDQEDFAKYWSGEPILAGESS